jgi:mono/diheme cytochrome c family protein
MTMRRKAKGERLPIVVGALALLALASCSKKVKEEPAKEAPSASTASSTPVATHEEAADPARGKELILTYECNRCHDETGYPPAVHDKHCIQCHANIMEDRFEAPAATIAKWKPRVKELADAPSLAATNARLKRDWVERYLLRPTDLRPHLAQYMPRLPVTPKDARDIAAYLVPDPDPAVPDDAIDGDMGRGRKLLDTRGCGSCHTFTGVAPLEGSPPPPMPGTEFERARRLAPDLRFVRQRMTKAKLVAWLRDPGAVKYDTPMPKIALTDREVNDLAVYLLGAELAEPPPKPKFFRLPLLKRKVTFKEVDERVFHRTCWHCHSEPDYAIGDGGPGNSGGFGFKSRGLNLSSYNGVTAGFLDDAGERTSVFVRDAEGVPRLVRALLARHDEESGAETGPVRGMPLGYAPLSAEDIQLVESWIAQGRPR